MVVVVPVVSMQGLCWSLSAKGSTEPFLQCFSGIRWKCCSVPQRHNSWNFFNASEVLGTTEVFGDTPQFLKRQQQQQISLDPNLEKTRGNKAALPTRRRGSNIRRCTAPFRTSRIQA